MTSTPPSRREATLALADVYSGGNLGDQAIQEAALRHHAEHHPDLEVVLMTTWPRMTEAIHGAASYLLCPGSGGSFYDRDREMGDGAKRSREHTSMVARLARGLGRRLGLRRLICEIRHARDTLRLLRRVDAVYVNGGGQINDEWGGPGEQPFTLAKLAVLCRLTRTPLAFVSVGARPLRSPLSKPFVALALKLASYTSVRDDDSLEVLEADFDVRDVHRAPDVAFAFRPAPRHRPRRGDHGSPSGDSEPVVAFSPISYLKPGVWALGDAEAFTRYREEVEEFLRRQLSLGRRVRLFATSHMDWEMVEDVHGRLSGERKEGDPGRLEAFVPSGHQDAMASFMEAIAGADVVVASRLHGLVLAHVEGIPTVAVSYDRKVDAHMASMGATDRLLPLRRADPDSLCTLVDAVLADRAAIVEQVRSAVDAERARVEDQYDLLAERLGL